MIAYLAAPFLICMATIVRDMAVSRRLHRWPYGEAAPAAPPADEWLVAVSVACMAAEREGEALASLLRSARPQGAAEGGRP